MIATVDRNEDWKISYSEFRVCMFPIQIVTNVHVSHEYKCHRCSSHGAVKHRQKKNFTQSSLGS